MKLTIIGHSLIDLRQKLFCDELRRQRVDVLEIYPAVWHKQKRDGGFQIGGGMNIRDYYFMDDAFLAIKKFKPDIIYSMSEMWQIQSVVSYAWAKKLNIPIVFFVWENINPVPIPDNATIIAGNSEAAAIHHTDYILPQVGIDPYLFNFIPGIEKEYDFVFMGRNAPEKGVEYIREVLKELNVKMLWRQQFLEYTQIPIFLNRARCQICYSQDTRFWKEQAGSYSNVEALFCGLSVITSDSAAIVEWLKGCPGVIFVPQKDVDALRDAMKDGGKLAPPEAREWVMKRYSNKVVAGKLIKILEEVIR